MEPQPAADAVRRRNPLHRRQRRERPRSDRGPRGRVWRASYHRRSSPCRPGRNGTPAPSGLAGPGAARRRGGHLFPARARLPDAGRAAARPAPRPCARSRGGTVRVGACSATCGTAASGRAGDRTSSSTGGSTTPRWRTGTVTWTATSTPPSSSRTQCDSATGRCSSVRAARHRGWTSSSTVEGGAAGPTPVRTARPESSGVTSTVRTTKWGTSESSGDSEVPHFAVPAHPRPRSSADRSRISTLRTLPVTVIGNSSTTTT